MTCRRRRHRSSSPPPGRKSAQLADQYGDGWITQPSAVKDPKMVAVFNQGAAASNRDPAKLGKRVELFAVVGDQNEVAPAAELWRFTSSGFKLDQANPVDIQHAADATPIDKVTADWAICTDPATHVNAVQGILNQGAMPFAHLPQHEPTAAVDLHRTKVLPKLH
jgi:alkanesulfonate monooxygenase SsuD/methylene tetrahydromethanopterin reductase-like flavin-dependent oxidoreductase (luciferase family)